MDGGRDGGRCGLPGSMLSDMPCDIHASRTLEFQPCHTEVGWQGDVSRFRCLSAADHVRAEPADPSKCTEQVAAGPLPPVPVSDPPADEAQFSPQMAALAGHVFSLILVGHRERAVRHVAKLVESLKMIATRLLVSDEPLSALDDELAQLDAETRRQITTAIFRQANLAVGIERSIELEAISWTLADVSSLLGEIQWLWANWIPNGFVTLWLVALGSESPRSFSTLLGAT